MTKINIPDRVCPHCGGTEWYVSSQIGRRTNKYSCVKRVHEKGKENYSINREKILARNKKIRSRTPKERLSEYAKRYRIKHKEKIKTSGKEYRSLHQERIKSYRKIYRIENREKIRRKNRELTSEYRVNLTDSYMRKVIQETTSHYSADNRRVKGSSITDEQIQMYREALMVKRKYLQLKAKNHERQRQIA